MNKTEYKEIRKELLELCEKIMKSKQPEYTNNNQNYPFIARVGADKLEILILTLINQSLNLM